MVYLLEDVVANQWCAYSSKSEWLTAIDKKIAMAVATVEPAEKKESFSIKVTQTDESGDWMVYDDYELKAGFVTRLLREIRVLPGDIDQQQVYAAHDGSMKRLSTSSRSLTTGQVVSESHDWMPTLPIWTKASEFPFAGFLRSTSSGALENRTCLPMTLPR